MRARGAAWWLGLLLGAAVPATVVATSPGPPPALASRVAAAATDAVLVGHRGTGSDHSTNPYPENSLPSIRKAFEEGADMVEVDVQLDRFGVPILWHDGWVSLGEARVRPGDLAREEFPVLEGPTGIRAEVPSLEQALDLAVEVAPHRLTLDLELKLHDDASAALLVTRVVDLLVRKRLAHRVAVTSFSTEALEWTARILPEVPLGLLTLTYGGALSGARDLREAGVELTWVLPFRFFLRSQDDRLDFAARARAGGWIPGAWTVNGWGKLRDFARDGIVFLLTDDPDDGW